MQKSKQNIDMKTSISINEIYAMLTSLSDQNKKWLADKLVADITRTKDVKTLCYPRLRKDRAISKQVMEMSIGTLPSDFDFDKESEKMWEELAQ